ncbi:AAA ATPase, partial [mine drainage metagenome]
EVVSTTSNDDFNSESLNGNATPEELVAVLTEQVAELRQRLQDSPLRMRALEEKLLEVNGQLSQTVTRNEKLTVTLQQAREHIATLREEVEKLTQPPSAYGIFLSLNDDGSADIITSGRKMRVSMHPDLLDEEITIGQEVALNDSFAVIFARSPE